MGVRRVKNSLVTVLVLLVVLSIIQCTAKTQVIKEDDETVLRRKVQEYWNYRIKGEWAKSYLYESPEFRETMKADAYINQNQRSIMKWEGFDILEVWTSGVEGHVKLNTKYRYLIPRTTKAAFERVVEEQWIKKDGQWYRFSTVA